LAEQPNAHHTEAKVMNSKSSYTALARLLLLLCSFVSASAHASEPGAFTSEILTPAGWDPLVPACTEPFEAPGELMTPSAWAGSTHASDSWLVTTCSELVVPADWV
jgi:hypothetical protein